MMGKTYSEKLYITPMIIISHPFSIDKCMRLSKGNLIQWSNLMKIKLKYKLKCKHEFVILLLPTVILEIYG